MHLQPPVERLCRAHVEEFSGVHKEGFSKGGFSNLCVIIML